MLFHVDHAPMNVLALALFIAALTGCASTGSTVALRLLPCLVLSCAMTHLRIGSRNF